jgi:hypothetical protein
VKFDDESNMMTLCRNNTGYKLTNKNRQKGRPKKVLVGSCLSATIRITTDSVPIVPYTGLNKEDCIFGENELCFIYPVENAIHEQP